MKIFNNKTYIIAEAGVNHNGDLQIALQMVKAAKGCGADCVKFQTFNTDSLVTKKASKAEYQVINTGNTESQYDMLKKLELSYCDFSKIKDYCDEIDIDFMSTPFDENSVELLEKLQVKGYKLSSGDITNKSLIEYIAKKNKPIILSTGMCVIQEIEEAVEWIEKTGNKEISLLHCTSNYPTSFDEVNMNSMITLKNRFSYRIGYSDHTEGIIIPIMAVSLGAKIIEKHFTLDRNMEGPDHKASLNPTEFKTMVDSIRNIETAFGSYVKQPTDNEKKTMLAARKSIVITKDLKKGYVLRKEDLCIKRPGNGVAPKYLDHFINKKIMHDMEQDSIIKLTDIEE